MHPKLTLIACALAGGFLPFERMLFAPEGEPAGGGGGAGGGSGTPAPAAGAGAPGSQQPASKTYDDHQVNALIAKERRAAEEKAARDIAETKAAFEKQIAEMNEKLELAGKSAEEREKILADKASKQLEAERLTIAKERDEAKQRAELTHKRLQQTIKRHAASAALAEAKAFPSAMADATEVFLQSVELDLDKDDDTKIVAVRFDGVAFKSVLDAAGAFLKAKPYFAAAPQGGTGTHGGAAGSLAGSPKDQALQAWGLATAHLQPRKAVGG